MNEMCAMRRVGAGGKRLMLMLQIMLSKVTAETYGPSRSAKGFLLATDILDGALLSDNPCLLCGLLSRRRALTGNDLFLRLSAATAGRGVRDPGTLL